MSILLDETIVGVWFMQTLPTQDWLAAINEIEPDKKYQLTYRFRYIVDDGIFISDDEKHWHRGEWTDTTKEVVLTKFRATAQMLATIAIGELYEVINNGDFDDFLERFYKLPFVHAMRIPNA